MTIKSYLFDPACGWVQAKGMIVLQILSYPCGYISKNIYFSLVILFTIIVAYFIRLLGLEEIVIISNELSIPSFLIIVLLVLNTVWLKFLFITKSYFLLSIALK